MPAVVEITSPASGAVLDGRFAVGAVTRGDRPVRAVEFRIDDRRLAIDDTPPYRVAAPALPDGVHTIEVRAWSVNGRTQQRIAIFPAD